MLIGRRQLLGKKMKQNKPKRSRGRPITVGATQTVNIAMPPNLVSSMDKIAADAGVTRSAVARLLIEEALAARGRSTKKATDKPR